MCRLFVAKVFNIQSIMITIYIFTVLILIIVALIMHRGKPMALVICVEILALLTIIAWLMYLKSILVLAAMAISF